MRFALLFAIGLVGQATPTIDLPPIERHGVGTVAIGADAQKIYEAFPPDRRELVDQVSLAHEVSGRFCKSPKPKA